LLFYPFNRKNHFVDPSKQRAAFLTGMKSHSTDTSITTSLLPVIACLLFGIFAVFINVAGFVYLLVQGAKSGRGIQLFVDNAFENSPILCYSIIAIEIAIIVLWPIIFSYFTIRYDKRLISMIKQMVVGWLVMLAFMSIVGVLILLAIFHDGKLGSVATFIMGLMTSPFTMEIILCSIGVGLIVFLNYIRLQLSGDEYVEMVVPEEKEKPL